MSDPEEAAAYLHRTNFKQVIEWLTAEAILRRPADPLAFVRNLVEQKLVDRGAEDYAADQPTAYVQRCYADAASLADEHGRIYGHVASMPGGLRAQASEAMQERVARLERLVKAATEIRTLEPREACGRIVDAGCKLLAADRATIFTVRAGPEAPQMLDLHVAEGAETAGISCAFGVGIAGTVALNQEVCNIHDAYTDPRFDSTADKASGFRTQNVVAVPILSPVDGAVAGVLQIINKRSGPFNSDDEEALKWLAGLAGVALYTATCYQGSRTLQLRAEAIIDLVHAVHENSRGIHSLIHSLTTRLPQIVGCDRCTVFIVDRRAAELWAAQGEVNLKVPLASAGAAASCAREGETVRMPDAYADERFNRDVDDSSGYVTRNLLCLPVSAAGRAGAVGVVQLINKLPAGSAFDADDERILQVFLGIVGSVIEGLEMTKTAPADDALGDDRADDRRAAPTNDRRAAPHGPALAEGDEDDE
ncbi:GAF domain-like protein [Pelagophyceae sp. CCMP2097]|nr:GAF domain-like protein [Pelagophyceae sp. CCMP2097]